MSDESAKLAVFAYMNTSKVSEAYTSETGSVIKTPPESSPLFDGILSPFPVAEERSADEYQVGC